MAAGTLDRTIFNDLIKDHKAQLSVDVELEEVDNRVKKGANSASDRIAAIKVETEEIKKQRQGERSEIGLENKVEALKPNESKSVNEENGIESLKKEVEYCRKMYASIEYNDKVKMGEARKGLGSKKNDESVSTKDARALYEKTLARFKDARINELENDKNISSADLKKKMHELVLEFGYKEAVDLYNERTDARAESLMKYGNKWDYALEVWGGAEKIANYYNKWPLYVKLGISAGLLGAGVAVGTAGGVAAGTVTAAVFAKRILGGITATVGTAKLLDALHQRGMKKDAGKDAEKLLADMGKDASMDKFKSLSALLDSKIANVDNQLKGQKKAAIVNKFIGITVGAFLGTGMASKAFGAVFHHGDTSLPKAPGTGATSNATGNKLPDFPKTGRYSDVGLAKGAGAAAAGATEHAPGSTEIPKFTMNPTTHQEIMHMPGKDVVKISVPENVGEHMHHDSFAHSLKEYIKSSGKVSPDEVKHATNLAFRDGVREYANTNGMSYDQAIHKLSRIHPGTTYEVTWDEHGMPKMHIHDGDVKFMKALKHVVHHGGHHAVHHAPVPTEAADVTPPSESLDVSNHNPYASSAAVEHAEYEKINKAIEVASKRDLTVSGSFTNGGGIVNPGLAEIQHNLSGPNHEHIAELQRQATEKAAAIRELAAKSESFNKISKAAIQKISENSSTPWEKIRNYTYSDAMKNPDINKRVTGTLKVIAKTVDPKTLRPQYDVFNGDEKLGAYVDRVSKAVVDRVSQRQ